MKLLLVPSSHVTENSPSSTNGFVNGLREEHETLFFTNIYMCKKAGFLHKKAAFSQKHIFVKKQYFYNRSICKKAAFVHKNDAFLQGPFFYATHIYIYI